MKDLQGRSSRTTLGCEEPRHDAPVRASSLQASWYLYPMSPKSLSDAEAKEILLMWPRTGERLWATHETSGAWIRAQPSDGATTGPKLYAPGAKLYSTQPDGLWAHFNGLDSCDVVVIEVCGSNQNLNDKRSRYMPSSHSVVLRVGNPWMEEPVKTRGRGGPLRSRRELAGGLPATDAKTSDVPIRHLRVLYALKNADYKKWCGEHTPTGYEYFIPHSSLRSYNSQKMQEFLRRMSIASQFYSAPKHVRL